MKARAQILTGLWICLECANVFGSCEQPESLIPNTRLSRTVFPRSSPCSLLRFSPGRDTRHRTRLKAQVCALRRTSALAQVRLHVAVRRVDIARRLPRSFTHLI
eukprot:1378761-Pleurochrysis_carterae.AAC.3